MKQSIVKPLAQNGINCWTAYNIAPVHVETITKILTFDTTSRALNHCVIHANRGMILSAS